MNEKKLDRREFIEKSTLGMLTTSLGLQLAGISCSKKSSSSRMITRTLGRTKLRIPVVSFGVMNSDNPQLLKKAVDMGIVYFDTAHGYLRGKSEQVIGEVVSELGVRDKVIIGTKMRFARDREKQVFLTEGSAREPLASESNLRSQLEVSLERLQTDYVDILYLHSCLSTAMVTFEPLMNALRKVKEEGKTRFIGISTHQDVPELIRAAVDAGVYDVIEIAYNYMDEHKEEIREANRYAAEHGVGIVAMKVMGGNRLNRNSDVQINHKAALKWVLSDENVCTTIPGMTTFDQMDLNMSVMQDLSLTEDEARELEVASMVPDRIYCQNCRTCIKTCPHRVEVPNLMRSYMYAEGYGNRIQAERTIAELPLDRGIEVCRSCDSCSAACRTGLKISQRIRRLMVLGFSGTEMIS